jgi:peptide/nickel transport system substrate-binding protein
MIKKYQKLSLHGTLHGFGSPGLTLIPDSMGFWFNDSIKDYAYDPTLASQLLDKAGYLDTDGDGVREMPGGEEPLTLRMYGNRESVWAPRVANLLRQMWGEIGVEVAVQALDLARLQAVCCPRFDYDVILWAWGSDPDPHFLLSGMSSDQIAGGLNETGYADPAYDALFA